MRWVWRGLLGLFAALLIGAAGLTIWALIPVSINPSEPDPAVTHANQLDPAAPPFQEGYFEHHGHTLHYVEAGEGTPIIFLHGFPSYWLSFIQQANDLRKDHRVILIDGLGVGRSDAPRDVNAYSLENMTAHLRALLEAKQLDQAHFVGHDWGAALALGFAQKYPDQVSSVTAISSPPQTILLQLMETNPQQQAISAYVERLKSANPVLLLALRVPDRIWKAPYLEHVNNGYLTHEQGNLFRKALASPKRIDAHINWYRANIPPYAEIQDTDFWPARTARISVPALLIWGDEDRVFVPEFIDLMAEDSDQLEVIRFADVGHWPHLERADEVTQALRRHIAAAE